MTERTIRMVQSCTADEAAAMVAAIRAFEDANPAGARAPPAAVGPSFSRQSAGQPGSARKDGVGVLWTRPGQSPRRSF